jgi:hypothetical protein
MLEHGFNNGVGFIKNKKILPSFREATEKLPHKKQKKGWSSSETVNPILNIFFLRLDRGIFFFVKNYIFSVVPFTSYLAYQTTHYPSNATRILCVAISFIKNPIALGNRIR